VLIFSTVTGYKTVGAYGADRVSTGAALATDAGWLFLAVVIDLFTR